MNFPNVLQFPKVCVTELAWVLSVIVQLKCLVYVFFLLGVRL